MRDCDDCVDYFDESGVQGRCCLLAGGELDLKGKYSEVSSGAINFNAATALADVAPFGDAFYEDPNNHDFRYINNVKPKNEQENINLDQGRLGPRLRHVDELPATTTRPIFS
jgi:hypothetical protein